ncbi:MAG: hypothetical protein JO049_23490 [Hyphomicrobiales bacterium]|nr:hypothetical protein [Hyphomicrobiales bacterium]
MHIDAAILSPISPLLGALAIGGATLGAAIYTHRCQNHLQRIAGEIAKRETVYADFVMTASHLLLHAFTHDEFSPSGDEHRLIGLINRMRLFAPPDVVSAAEAVLRAIAEIALRPSVELRQVAKEALSESLPDPLLAFSEICRADLDSVRGERPMKRPNFFPSWPANTGAIPSPGRPQLMTALIGDPCALVPPMLDGHRRGHPDQVQHRQALDLRARPSDE